MSAMFSRDVEMVLGALAMVFLALAFAAKRRPDIAWLRPFRMPELSKERQERQRRRANVYAGAEFILLGLAIPLGYVVLTVMMFNNFEPLPTALVLASSALCLGLGVVAIVKNARG
jgi:hypothetical protein